MNSELLKKVSRLIVAGFDGTTENDHARFCLQDLKIGNWIYFARNVQNYGQLAELSRWTIRETLQNNGAFPFMTIDQEGGIVSRLHGDLNTYPGAMACAAAGTPEETGKAAEITARHLRSLGLNMNLAPVADINSNPANPIVGPRSFGDNPEQVTRYALAAAEGYLRGGVVPVLKHFPGHGDTAVDSHLALPSLEHSRRMLENRELIPFREGIANHIPAMMVGHMVIPALDSSGRPASLSENMIGGLLRKTMGFGGLVLTDCLEMKGITNHYTTEEAVLAALQAGADLLFISHSPQEQEKGVKALYDEVQSGRLSESRIDESLQRMADCRSRCLPGLEEAAAPVSGWTGSNPEPFLHELSRRSMTILRNNAFLPPEGLEDSEETLILHIRRPEQFIGENTVSGGDPLKRLERAFPASVFRTVPAETAEEELERDPVRTEQFRRILAVTADAGFHPGAVSSLQKLTEQGVPVGIAVMRTPYEAAFFPRADFLLLGYENTVPAVEGLIACLKGEAKAEGRCPVEIPGLG